MIHILTAKDVENVTTPKEQNGAFVGKLTYKGQTKDIYYTKEETALDQLYVSYQLKIPSASYVQYFVVNEEGKGTIRYEGQTLSSWYNELADIEQENIDKASFLFQLLFQLFVANAEYGLVYETRLDPNLIHVYNTPKTLVYQIKLTDDKYDTFHVPVDYTIKFQGLYTKGGQSGKLDLPNISKAFPFDLPKTFKDDADSLSFGLPDSMSWGIEMALYHPLFRDYYKGELVRDPNAYFIYEKGHTPDFPQQDTTTMDEKREALVKKLDELREQFGKYSVELEGILQILKTITRSFLVKNIIQDEVLYNTYNNLLIKYTKEENITFEKSKNGVQGFITKDGVLQEKDDPYNIPVLKWEDINNLFARDLAIIYAIVYKLSTGNYPENFAQITLGQYADVTDNTKISKNVYTLLVKLLETSWGDIVFENIENIMKMAKKENDDAELNEKPLAVALATHKANYDQKIRKAETVFEEHKSDVTTRQKDISDLIQEFKDRDATIHENLESRRKLLDDSLTKLGVIKKYLDELVIENQTDLKGTINKLNNKVTEANNLIIIVEQSTKDIFKQITKKKDELVAELGKRGTDKENAAKAYQALKDAFEPLKNDLETITMEEIKNTFLVEELQNIENNLKNIQSKYQGIRVPYTDKDPEHFVANDNLEEEVSRLSFEIDANLSIRLYFLDFKRWSKESFDKLSSLEAQWNRATDKEAIKDEILKELDELDITKVPINLTQETINTLKQQIGKFRNTLNPVGITKQIYEEAKTRFPVLFPDVMPNFTDEWRKKQFEDAVKSTEETQVIRHLWSSGFDEK